MHVHFSLRKYAFSVSLLQSEFFSKKLYFTSTISQVFLFNFFLLARILRMLRFWYFRSILLLYLFSSSHLLFSWLMTGDKLWKTIGLLLYRKYYTCTNKSNFFSTFFFLSHFLLFFSLPSATSLFLLSYFILVFSSISLMWISNFQF